MTGRATQAPRRASLGRQVCPSWPRTLFRLSLSWVFFLLLGKRKHSLMSQQAHPRQHL